MGLLMPTPVCITSKHLCTAGLYAAHDPYHIRTLRLPCVKPSPTCHAALGRCGEARDEATHLHDLVSSSLVYTVFVSKAPIHAFRGGDRVQKVGGLNKSFLYTKANQTLLLKMSKMFSTFIMGTNKFRSN